MFKHLTDNLGIVFRVLKNALLRPFRLISSRFKYTFNIARVSSAVPSAVSKIPLLVKRKPEKREDYFDWGRVYIAKSLVFIVTAVIIALVLVYIFFLHSLFTSWWWVKDMQFEDKNITDYNGKVRLYYDDDMTTLKFEGKLDEGYAVGYGEEYWENGRNKYFGNYVEGVYSGSGTLYLEDGTVLYRGLFENGEYNGYGELSDNGSILCGEFKNGQLQGSGTIKKNNTTLFSGTFVDGVAEGICKQNYDNGTLHYSGTFSGGLPQGEVLEYYPNGKLKYNGSFTAGEYDGQGTLYSENGKKLYSGSFEMGKYSGTGTLYENGSRVYTGEFEEGEFSGSGTLYGNDGSVTAGNFKNGVLSGLAERSYQSGMKYEGVFADDLPSGTGTLSDAAGNTIYSGKFLDGDIDYSVLINSDTQAAAAFFPYAVRSVYDDCFRLTDTSGFILECSFASGETAAKVRSVYNLPIGGSTTKIYSADDISAPNALSVSETAGVLPEQAKLLGISEQKVRCYAAVYSSVVVKYWVSSDGTLLVKSAYSASSGEVPSDSSTDTEQDRDEITKLFEDIGLDIKDFESLGF